MKILKRGSLVVNLDNDADYEGHIADGWIELSALEVSEAGMLGYEHLVGPHNTTVNSDGSITFTPPEPPSEAQLFDSLRVETEARLASTDVYGMDDYPDNDRRAAFRAYRAALRALNHQDGAPWDGGGELTPWPELPDVG